MNQNLILIVEDDVISCELFKELLERENIKPFIIVNNGEQAIEICKTKQEVKLVLMDYKLPGMDGCEALREIKKIRKDLPIVVQTACVYSGDKELYMNCGFDDYLSKPIHTKDLLTIISKYCTYQLN